MNPIKRYKYGILPKDYREGVSLGIGLGMILGTLITFIVFILITIIYKGVECIA